MSSLLFNLLRFLFCSYTYMKEINIVVLIYAFQDIRETQKALATVALSCTKLGVVMFEKLVGIMFFRINIPIPWGANIPIVGFKVVKLLFKIAISSAEKIELYSGRIEAVSVLSTSVMLKLTPCSLLEPSNTLRGEAIKVVNGVKGIVVNVFLIITKSSAYAIKSSSLCNEIIWVQFPNPPTDPKLCASRSYQML
ncbi:hypothetical protein FF38_13348 [Lucilia cuprina]|uniref:Uncharacterized protein n=1 Tax=Lucilia cuprina TaxID=7375 RepID=A0A0L0BTV9_LUCCU|nr:hypothetical protein FF38_13348 [Lucilia cuprina]